MTNDSVNAVQETETIRARIAHYEGVLETLPPDSVDALSLELTLARLRRQLWPSIEGAAQDAVS
jgi:hypothetical protein